MAVVLPPALLKSVLAQGLALHKSEITRKEESEVTRQPGQKESRGPLEDTSSFSLVMVEGSLTDLQLSN